MNDANNTVDNAGFQNTDDADAPMVLAAVRHCANSWVGSVRLLGNVRACDISRACTEALAALSTPNAPVEREAIARIIDPAAPFDDIEGVTWSRFDLARRDIALSTADKIATILAVRLDEAAIRADEREKQREIDAKIAEHLNGWGVPRQPELAHHIASVIRGGKQP